MKDHITRSKSYPVERKECWGHGSSRCQVCNSIKIIEFTSFTNHSFDCNDVSLTCWAVRHAANNIYVTPSTILEIDEIAIKVMLGNLKVLTWKMSDKSFLESLFTKWSLWLSDPSKQEFHWITKFKTWLPQYPDGLNIECDC